MGFFTRRNAATTTTTTTGASNGYNGRRDNYNHGHVIDHVHRVWPALVLAFATWAVSLAGIAVLQHDCPSTDAQAELPSLGGTFTPLHSGCRNLLRFPWFVVSFQFAIIFGLAIALLMRRAHASRVAFTGLFSISCILYIYLTDKFLTALYELPQYNNGGQQMHRMRTVLAGFLMTAAADCFVIIALGVSEDWDPLAHEQYNNGQVVKTHTQTNEVLLPVNANTAYAPNAAYTANQGAYAAPAQMIPVNAANRV